MKNKHGFTLVEMLFVLSIIVLLMMLVIPQVTSKTEMVKAKGCNALIDVIDAQIQLYEIEEGHLPSSLEALVQGDYLEEKQIVCPDGGTLSLSHGQAYCSKHG